MKILAIESSCDETSAAVVENGGKILSNVVASQESVHARYFGVVPELASRAHLEKINYLVEKSAAVASGEKRPDAGNWKKYIGTDINAIAYTYGPGLMGSLLIGQIAAQTLAYLFDKPLVPVNHLEGHISSIFFENPSLKYPFIALIVSGGHTELVICRKPCGYKVLGYTRDDACGEAFDKVAKLLDLSYPGGPVIDKIAGKAGSATIKFPRPYMKETWDFSFSGLKTAVAYYLKSKNGSKPDSGAVADICASFQDAVADTLVAKAVAAAGKFSIDRIAVVGGVASNSALRKHFRKEAALNNLKVYFPSPGLCTDNAAMIAAAGYWRYKAGRGISFDKAVVDSNAEL